MATTPTPTPTVIETPTEPVQQQQPVEPTPAEPTRYAEYYQPEPEPLITPTPPDLTDTIRSLKEEITALRTQVAQPPTMSTQEKQNFLSLLKDGKVEEAEEYLTSRAVERSNRAIEERVAKLQEEITQRTRFETQINDFVSTVKSQNPDLLPFEELITTKASARLDLELKSGRIQNQSQLFKAYQKAVLDEVENTKRLIQTIRGDGKQDALTTRQQVLSSSPARPNPVTSNGDATPKDEKQPMTTADYLAARQKRMQATKGVTAT